MTKEDQMRVFYDTLGSIDYHLTMADKLMAAARRKRDELPEEYKNAFREMGEQLQKTQATEATIRNDIAKWFHKQGRKYIRKKADAPT